MRDFRQLALFGDDDVGQFADRLAADARLAADQFAEEIRAVGIVGVGRHVSLLFHCMTTVMNL